MISLHGVSSALVARSESWVRTEANRLSRRLPSNIEKADLIQVGLIAVAQASLSFEWEGEAESEAARDAFVRYARLRVKGAMLDELRQMDNLGRGERRKIKVVQIARERWQAAHGRPPTLGELSAACSLGIDDISRLDRAALEAQTESLSNGPDSELPPDRHQPATPADETEARVDTAIVLRRLEKFFAGLPERDRQLIDTYLGIGLTPAALAKSWKLSPSRISQMYDAACRRIAVHFGNAAPVPLPERRRAANWEQQIAARESALAEDGKSSGWGALIEQALEPADDGTRMKISAGTRWG